MEEASDEAEGSAMIGEEKPATGNTEQQSDSNDKDTAIETNTPNRVIRSYIVVFTGLLTIISSFFVLSALRFIPDEVTGGDGLWDELINALTTMLK